MNNVPSAYAVSDLGPSRVVVAGEDGEVESQLSNAERALSGLHVPVTLDIIRDLGHALTHEAICRGSLRLLQGIYERRRATLH